jgi:lactate dehydrogenase-like 2-hydroxyacid dehydrogenase
MKQLKKRIIRLLRSDSITNKEEKDKLLKLDNFIYTPHIAGWTLEATEITTNIILNSIQLLLQGKKPPTVVN